jgi:hypothetical protein
MTPAQHTAPEAMEPSDADICSAMRLAGHEEPDRTEIANIRDEHQRFGSWTFLFAHASTLAEMRQIREALLSDPAIEAACKAHCDFFGGTGWWNTGLIADTKPKAMEAMRSAVAALIEGANHEPR